jgi:hypothetical protein
MARDSRKAERCITEMGHDRLAALHALLLKNTAAK